MSGFDARVWLGWVLAAAVVTIVARNPLYTLLVLLASRLVDAVWGRPDSHLQLPLLRFGVLVLLFSAAFNGLFVHRGETVLLRLPAGWPLLGGPVTLESLLYGAHNGLILLTLLSLFAAFNRIVPAHALVRLTPRSFHDLGVVLLIALTYVPETLHHLQRVREAQAIRGHRLQSLRDWRPIAIPLLVGGLERAMGVAEAMVARGYGATAGRRQEPRLLAGLALGLALAFGGWLLLLWQRRLGWLLLAAGIVLLVSLLWRSGRRTHHTRYRPRPWHTADTALLLASAVPLLLVVSPWPIVDSASLNYTPYPRLHLPPFDPLLGIALTLFAIPAVGPIKDDYD